MNKNRKAITISLIIIGIILIIIGGYINNSKEKINTTENNKEEIKSELKPIEEVRKDTFINLAKSYTDSAITLWYTDSLTCNNAISSLTNDGEYYIEINSSNMKLDISTNTLSNIKLTDIPILLEHGGKSPWNNREILGYIKIKVETIENKKTTTFFIKITDDIHYIIDDTEYILLDSNDVKTDSKIKYKDVLIDSSAIKCIES